MKIHEYQAKQLFKAAGVPVLPGRMVTDPAKVGAAYDELAAEIELPAGIVAVKAQIHAGGRGEAGGVKVCKGRDAAVEAGQQIHGKPLVTRQTGPEGQLVRRLYVEAGCAIKREVYVAMLVDRAIGKPILMACAEGGVEIEEIAAERPEAILKEIVDPDRGLEPYQARRLAFGLGMTGKTASVHCANALVKLSQVFLEKDASLVEINPLVETEDGGVIALDGKIAFDESALYRHPDLVELEDPDEINQQEREAAKWDLNYIHIGGNIGCMVNGAGLAMATMDTIKHFGGEPANFLDVGGGATPERVTEAFKLLLSDSAVKAIFVNIFGGIVRCDDIATGIIEAAHAVSLSVPLVVRLEGTNVQQGKKLLEESGLNLSFVEGMNAAAEKAVAAAKGA